MPTECPRFPLIVNTPTARYMGLSTPGCFGSYNPNNTNSEMAHRCRIACAHRADCKEATSRAMRHNPPAYPPAPSYPPAPQQSAYPPAYPPAPQHNYPSAPSYAQAPAPAASYPRATQPVPEKTTATLPVTNPQPANNRPITVYPAETPMSRLGREMAAGALSAMGGEIYRFFQAYRFQPTHLITCKSCSSQIPPNSRFCGACGHGIS